MADPNDPGANPLTDISQILAQAAAGRGQGRYQASDLLLRQGSLANQMYNSALGAKSLEASLPTTRMNQVARGDFAANAQDVGITGPDRVLNNVTHFTGGIRPSAFGSATRDAGSKIAGIAGSAMGNESMPTAPTLPQLPSGGVLDDILSGASGATGLLGALAGPGSGGSFDLGKLFGGIKNKLFPPSTGNAPGNDFGDTGIPFNKDFGGPEQGKDPSGVQPNLPGSQVDPMQQYWDWLAQQRQPGGGDNGSQIPDGSGWGGE